MTTIQPGLAPRRLSSWQPDLFRATRLGPMRTIWRSKSPDDIRLHSRKLQGRATLILEGETETDGPFGDIKQIYFWFRCSPNMSVCALCVEENPFAKASHPYPPRPTLLYLYPTISNQQTLVRWLVREYAAETGALPEDIKQRGSFDLSGIVEDWPLHASILEADHDTASH